MFFVLLLCYPVLELVHLKKRLPTTLPVHRGNSYLNLKVFFFFVEHSEAKCLICLDDCLNACSVSDTVQSLAVVDTCNQFSFSVQTR